MTTAEKIKDKLKILKDDPKKFFKIVKDILKVHLGLLPNDPEDGKRYTSELEVQILRKYARQANLGIVEIGVLDGKTTKEMARVARAPIYGIDPIIPDSMNKRLVGSEEIIRKNLEFYKGFHFYKDFSFNVAKNWQLPFDFIFIDGDHTYEAVRQDCEDWLPHLFAGGFIGFHDSAPVTSVPGMFEGWPGPKQLVDELKNDPRVELVETQDSLTVFKKLAG